ncbi:DUF6344 domain-containing protein [Streptomyces sp. NPDC050504]|uniref:DUF6344 domain-containing protein n=1 Tax=Streptomyces sp. NPDC050504 TaxID=3365618 RepID=UPI0037A3C906
MATTKVKNLWTALVAAFFAILASLGLAAPAAATTQQAVSHEHTATSPVAALQAPQTARWTLSRPSSRPPTMKQRIRAEAHGSSPAARHLPSNATDAAPADP